MNKFHLLKCPFFIVLFIWVARGSQAEDGVYRLTPVLTVQAENISAIDVSNFLTESCTRADSGLSSVARLERRLLRQRTKSPADCVAVRGATLFWNPARPGYPEWLSFQEVSSDAATDLSQPISPGNVDGEFRVTRPAPGFWEHAWHPASGTTFADSALYSIYFAPRGNFVWESTSSQLLNVSLPELHGPQDRSPKLRITGSFSNFSKPAREALLAAADSFRGTSLQRRNNELFDAWLQRKALVQAGFFLLQAAVRDDMELVATAEKSGSSELQAIVQLRADSAATLQQLSEVLPEADMLTAVRSEQPWLSLRLAFGIPKLLRDAAPYLERQRLTESPANSQLIWLLRILRESSAVQLSFSGIRHKSDGNLWVLGLHSDIATEIETPLTNLIRKSVVQLSGSGTDLVCTSAGNNSTRWIVFSSTNEAELADRLWMHSESTPSVRSAELLGIDLDLGCAPPMTSFGGPAALAELLDSQTGESLFMVCARAIEAMKTSISVEQQENWRLHGSVTGNESCLQLRLQCGEGIARAVTACGIYLFEELKVHRRSRLRTMRTQQ